MLIDKLSLNRLAVGQGLYYLITGIWPLVSMRTFVAVSGPKVDLWLVNTVGLLLIVVGGVLFLSGIRRSVPLESFLLATGSAAALSLIEIYYVAVGRISGIYLLDALVEITLIVLWFKRCSREMNRRT